MKTNYFLPTICAFLFFLLISCSFDYSDASGSDKDQPDIVMENVEYVRVRSAELQARFQAELAERYEERRLMQLRNFSFEQFGGDEEVNAFGRAGSASIEIDSLDMRLDNGVRIDVESEDMAIETLWLEWKDKEKLLNGGEEEEVQVYQESGTAFTGVGFHADARRRTWEFTGNVSGTYIYDDDEEEEEEGDTEELIDTAESAEDEGV
jgi:LPS export ABC transporter protein LptC